MNDPVIYAVVIIGGIVIIGSLVSFFSSKSDMKERDDSTLVNNDEIIPHKSLRRQQNALLRLKKVLELERENIDRERAKLNLSFEMLSLERKELGIEKVKHSFECQQAVYKLKQEVHRMKNLERSFSLDKREFSIEQQKSHLDVYNREVKHLIAVSDDNYKAQKRDIQQREKEMVQNLRDEKIKLKEMHQAQKVTLSNLTLQARSNELDQRDMAIKGKDVDLQRRLVGFRQDELDRRFSAIQAIENYWAADSEWNKLEHYKAQGFQPFSPQIQELENLRQEVSYLKNQVNLLQAPR